MIVSMETDGSFSEGPTLTLLQSNDGVGAGLVKPEEAWLGFRATVSAVLLLELLLGVGGNLTVLVLYCGHCSLLESVSHAVTLSLHMLDLLLCLLCLPITAILLLLGGASSPHHVLLCCLHESAATFASVGTALNLLLISLDRYDISVRPANRLLTQRRAAFLLAGVWVVSLTLPVLPFVEAGLGSGATHGSPVYSNSTLMCSQLVGTLQAHLFLQAPIFLCSLAVMLFTYSRILQALRIRIGHPARAQRGTTRLVRRPWQHRKRSAKSPDHMTKTVSVSPPPLSTGPLVASDTITTVTMNTETNTPSVSTPRSPTPTTATTATTPFTLTPNVGFIPLNPSPSISTITTPLKHTTSSTALPCNPSPTISTTPLSPSAPHAPPSVGVGASVSAILALRRAVRRHRDRRERQKRVFRMSVIIVLSFLLCWAPLSITPLLHLAIGPSDWLERLRVCFLVLAYWTVVLHPLLYAFTRQKLRKVLHTRLHRLRNNNTHTTGRIKQRNRRKHRADCSDTTDRCLMEAVRE
ncbi:G-protein coupled receptor 22 [Neoarius graeffei]|uniref:G-protein coupled receptor 22 n=1 Tax=Neoarius graeffei TaxID=443677 RepID=UPI00298C66AE|nr:G-protein coupled receptor 22 [Neoarius graeffei]